MEHFNESLLSNETRELLQKLTDDELFELTELILSEKVEDQLKAFAILGKPIDLPTIIKL